MAKKRSKPKPPPAIRDRIRALRRVPASELIPNPSNWRTHPQAQQEALRGVLNEIGYSAALIAREREDGSLVLLDGHLRKDTTPDAVVPVLVLDVDEAEADLLLASLDPLAAMAGADQQKLDALLREVQTSNQAVATMLTEIAQKHEILTKPNGEVTDGDVEELDAGEEDEDGLDLFFKAPFPWFGGKSRVAKLVWKRFGDVPNVIEPFFGSGAVLLNRPTPFDGTETINDKDGLVCNFWRAVKADPDKVAEYADWPVSECDLTARHAWLVGQKETLQARLEGDPEYFEAKIAGWWCWGMACWIGSGFCSGNGPWRMVEMEDGSRQLVHLGNEGQGVNRQRVNLTNEGQGVNRKRVNLSGHGQGHGIRQCVDADPDGNPGLGECGLLSWMQALSSRLRRVRVCCGDWTRVCGGNSGDALRHFFAGGDLCGVFLDPPYSLEANRDMGCYNVDDGSVAHAVREWCIRHGDDPRLRLALCGYEGEHDMPKSWDCVKWKAHGGMSTVSQGDSQAKANKFRERLWFSPHCLPR
jgi:hypothetical protein